MLMKVSMYLFFFFICNLHIFTFAICFGASFDDSGHAFRSNLFAKRKKDFHCNRSRKQPLHYYKNFITFVFMNRDEEKMLTDTLIDLGLTMNKLLVETKELRGDIQQMRGDIQQLRGDIQQLQKQQAKTNIALGEMRLSYMKLDASFNKMSQDFNKYAQRNDDRATNHETRIVLLEEKTSGSSYIAKEPATEYKRKRKK